MLGTVRYLNKSGKKRLQYTNSQRAYNALIMQCHQHNVSKYTVQYINILMMALKCIFLSFGRTVLVRVFVISRKKNLISE